MLIPNLNTTLVELAYIFCKNLSDFLQEMYGSSTGEWIFNAIPLDVIPETLIDVIRASRTE